MLTAEELKQLGNSAFANNQYKKAAKIYRDAIKLDPNNSILYSNRALSFIKLQDWDRALRDCTVGLSLQPDTKSKVKLTYRKGLVYKSTSQMTQAKRCFEEVLEIDPTNESAKVELKELGKKRHKQQTGEINITAIDSLPPRFKALIEDQPAKQKPTVNEKQIDSKKVEEISKELFPTTSKKMPLSEPKRQFSELPSMLPLHSLKNLSGDKLAKGYLYVLNIPVSTYQDIFETGIDAEFLEFYFRACLYVARNNIDSWELRMYELLECFLRLKKFDLSLMMCPSSLVNEVSNLVNRMSNQEFASTLRKILSV